MRVTIEGTPEEVTRLLELLPQLSGCVLTDVVRINTSESAIPLEDLGLESDYIVSLRNRLGIASVQEFTQMTRGVLRVKLDSWRLYQDASCIEEAMGKLGLTLRSPCTEKGARATDLKIMGFSTLVRNALYNREKLRVAGELADLSENELLGIRLLGKKGIAEIRERLSDLGLSLREG